jgi:hypothetical protein
MVSGDDAVELWLSSDDNPANKIKRAYTLSYTDFHEMNKYPSQTSVPVHLVSGQRYYIEILHKEGNGGDHVTVAWKLPDGTTEMPIPGNRLSPYSVNAVSASRSKSVYSEMNEYSLKPELHLQAYPNPFKSSSNIILTASEKGEIKMELYDLKGRLVRKLFKGDVDAGVPTTIKLKEDGLARGVYIIHLVSKNGVLNKKITLAR